MRPLEDLLSPDDPAWPEVQGWIREGSAPVEILPPSVPGRDANLEWLQVTLRSSLGAVAYETGGLLVDRGWLRLLGSGHSRLPRSLLQWNRGRTWRELAESRSHILVADDAIGGLFALGCGGEGFPAGEIVYFPPDTLRWETLEMGFSDFLGWCFSGGLEEFYGDYRWEGWEKDVEALGGDRVFDLLPPPFLKGLPFSQRSRASVPIEEHYDLYQDYAEQLRDVPDGTQIVLRRGKRPG